jgi:formamidopyrimidine-DNA glycosylase
MPELPEVETVRRMLRRELQNRVIVAALLSPDDLVLSGTPPEAFVSALVGSRVLDVGRKGKYWWLELDRKPWLFGHLGMSGWIHHLSPGEPEPRFWKLILEVEGGSRIAITDARRLGRVWLGESPATEKAILKLGFDALEEPPGVETLQAALKRRKTPIKAVLLDQTLFAGVGNYLADEALYQARISPKRLAASLDFEEVGRLEAALGRILRVAVDVGADESRFPKDWLFHHRWGGEKGPQTIGGHRLARETIGGRTTAWVPELQH